MRFEPQKKGKLKVILTPQDMASLNLTYDQMDYNDRKTRLLLSKLLETARQKGRFLYPDNSRLLIELFPTLEGGCVLLFTILAAGGQEPSAANDTFAFSFQSLEPLGQTAARLDALQALPGSEGCVCTLYRLNEEYRLLCQLRRPIGPDRQRSHPCLKELRKHGREAGTGRIAAAYCEEHGALLAAQDALKKHALCWK